MEERAMKKEKAEIVFKLAEKAGNTLIKTASATGKAVLNTVDTAGKLLYKSALKA